MIERKFVINSLNGLSSKVSMQLVRLSNQFESEILIIHHEDFANLKSIMSTFTLVIKNSDKFILKITGNDEGQAYISIKNLLEKFEISEDL